MFTGIGQANAANNLINQAGAGAMPIANPTGVSRFLNELSEILARIHKANAQIDSAICILYGQPLSPPEASIISQNSPTCNSTLDAIRSALSIMEASIIRLHES